MSLGITVIMPLYLRKPSREHERAIESVLSQKCDVELELLIVDDGSEAAVPAVSDPRVRVLRLPRNYGISYALNAGLTQARHDWIARIDGDDFWRPGKLAKQWEMLQADPDLTLVASGMRLVHAANPKLDRDEIRGGDWQHVLGLTKRIGCPFAHSSIVARRDVFEMLGGYPQSAWFHHAEDYALWAQWIRFFKVAICEEVFVEYAVSEGQISSRYQAEQLKASELAWRILAPSGGNQDRSLTLAAQKATEIANRLGITLLEASRALFTAWRYYEYILVDDELFEAASTLLPDRAVHRVEEADRLLADRFFYLTAKKRTA